MLRCFLDTAFWEEVTMSNVTSKPVELTDAELDHVHGGGLTKKNGGDNSPGGNAFGVPTVTSGNGNEPPGQNKGPGNS
jgi:hypothetical protein